MGSQMRAFLTPAEIETFAALVDEACTLLRCDDSQKTRMAIRVLSFAATRSPGYNTLLAQSIYRRSAADEVL
jgi:hypothetical protein